MERFRNNLYQFLEEPKSGFALSVRFLIIVLIIVSAGAAIVQLFWPGLLSAHTEEIRQFEIFALGIFTIEFLVRWYATGSWQDFIKRPSNWIDFLAIAPFYFGINDAVILRILRALRLLKLIKSFQVLNTADLFDFKHSILRVVSPLIIILIGIKSFFWMLESRGLWVIETNFDTLFTIIGFALGVVLSQKVGKSFGKHVAVQDAMASLHGKLSSLQLNLNTMKDKAGDKMVYQWLSEYMRIYHAPREGALVSVRKNNKELYEQAKEIGNTELIPFHRLAAMMAGVFDQSIVIQQKRTSRTPKAYNILLQQTTIMYLLLLIVFIPGGKGMISVIFAGYLLYGMFHLTNDFDQVTATGSQGSDENLITVSAERISIYLDELAKMNTNNDMPNRA